MSSKFRSVAVRASVVIFWVLALMPIGPAAAQSFVEGLFGNDPTAPPRAAAGYLRRQPLGSPAHAPVSPFTPYSAYAPYARPLGLFSPYQAYAPHNPFPTPDRDTYRTLCVRMCDGFYFPVSYAIGSAAFTRDAEACAAACGEDARLFYHPNPGGDVEDMVDLTGRSYASYPTAFRYRKTLVKGCGCRPQPWSEAERARHRAYAAVETPPVPHVEGDAAEAFPAPSDEHGAAPAPPLWPMDRSAFTSAVGGPAVSPYVADGPAPAAAKRNLRAHAARLQKAEAWSSHETGPGAARRRGSPGWRTER